MHHLMLTRTGGFSRLNTCEVIHFIIEAFLTGTQMLSHSMKHLSPIKMKPIKMVL